MAASFFKAHNGERKTLKIVFFIIIIIYLFIFADCWPEAALTF